MGYRALASEVYAVAAARGDCRSGGLREEQRHFAAVGGSGAVAEVGVSRVLLDSRMRRASALGVLALAGGHFGRSRLGDQVLRLPHPVFLLDAAA